MGTENVKGSNYAWAVAIACIAFYAVPLGFAANHAGLFITPVMNEFGWSRTDATLFMSIQPWVAALCTPACWQAYFQVQPPLDHDRLRAGLRLGQPRLRLVHRAVAVEHLRCAVWCFRSILDVHRYPDHGQPLVR